MSVYAQNKDATKRRVLLAADCSASSKAAMNCKYENI